MLWVLAPPRPFFCITYSLNIDIFKKSNKLDFGFLKTTRGPRERVSVQLGAGSRLWWWETQMSQQKKAPSSRERRKAPTGPSVLKRLAIEAKRERKRNRKVAPGYV